MRTLRRARGTFPGVAGLAPTALRREGDLNDHYLLVASRDPWTHPVTRRCFEPASDLSREGHRVTLFLVQNGVLPARRGTVDAMAILRVSHVGLCVADLEGSLRFWRDGLGFRERSRLDATGAETDALLELRGVDLRAVYLERDGLRLELLHFASPGVRAEAAARPMNQPGLTHLSLRVDDLDRALARLAGCGGRVLDATRVALHGARTRAVFVTDPDGTRVELVEAPGDPARLPGERSVSPHP